MLRTSVPPPSAFTTNGREQILNEGPQAGRRRRAGNMAFKRVVR